MQQQIEESLCIDRRKRDNTETDSKYKRSDDVVRGITREND